MKPYLQLVRAPNLFTAATDAVAGFVLMAAVDGKLPKADWRYMAALAFISVVLYASGAVFNDCLDLEHDRRFRPERPIPSGGVSLRGAYALGLGLVVAALVASMFVGTTTVLYTGLLITAIWLYNGILKRFAVLGALSMGLCRFLNMQLGMSTGMSLAYFRVNTVLIWAPLLLGAYTAIVTAVSHYEDRPAGRAGPWVLFCAAVGLCVVGSGAAVLVTTETLGRIMLILIILGAAGTFIATLVKVTFASVRRAVGIAVLLIIAFDAALVLGTRDAPLWLGFLMLALLAPAALLSRAASPS